MSELDRLDGQPIDRPAATTIVHAVARAALMGARGNSGVILSQIVRGAAEELASRPGELVDPVLVAAAFASAADAAYESVRDPAEGTMLTVIREMAHAVSHAPRAHGPPAPLRRRAGDTEQDAAAGGGARGGRAGRGARGGADARAARRAGRGRRRRCRGARPGRDPGGDRRGTARRARRAAGASRTTSPRGRRGRTTSTAGSGTAPTSSSPGRASTPGPSSPGSRRSATRCWSSATEATLKVHVHTDEPEVAVAVFEDVGDVQRLDVADMREQIAARETAPGARAHRGGRRWSRAATACGRCSRDSAPTWSTAARPSTRRPTRSSPGSTR